MGKCKRCGGNHLEHCHVVQNYGEQHPYFHSKEMQAYRKEDRQRALSQTKNITPSST